MIVEGLVTTLADGGGPHLAAMGPTVAGNFHALTLRPFPTSATYRNLLRHGEGVFHTTDDALLVARAAVGDLPAVPPTAPAEAVRGFVLADCCRAFEFRVADCDTTGERVRLTCEVVGRRSVREFLGFCRARHAVVEAAVLATRFHLLPLADVAAEFAKLRVVVDKTGGEAEFEAMALLERKLAEARAGGPA